jgi:hypothetical protein
MRRHDLVRIARPGVDEGTQVIGRYEWLVDRHHNDGVGHAAQRAGGRSN